MASIYSICFLFTMLVCCTFLYLVETNVTGADKPGNSEDRNKFGESIGLSSEHFHDVVKFINESKLYEQIQNVLVRYVQSFVMESQMIMRTKSGRITVPISDKIMRNLSTMAKHIIHIQHTFTATNNETVNFISEINKFRFVRNNTVLLDKVVEHANGSFKAHRDIENPEKLSFYHALRSDARFFKTEHLNQSMEDVIQIQRKASPSFSEVATGRLFGRNSKDLNSDECLHIAEYASADNIKYSVQFYEAAVRRLDTHEVLMINKSQILEKVINFYTQYGSECEHKLAKLQTKLKKAQAEEREHANDEDEEEEDDDGDDGDDSDNVELAKDTKERKGDGTHSKHQKINEINRDESPDVKEYKPEETKEIKETNNPNSDKNERKDGKDLNETDEIDNNKDEVDRNDERCIREVIRKSSKLSATHDEL